MADAAGAAAALAAAPEPFDPAPLSFALRLEGGQAAVTLERPARWTCGRIDRLVLGWPDVRYPFDLSSGLAQLRRRRGRLHMLAAQVELQRLLALLDGRALGRFGIREPWLGEQAGALVLRFQAEVGGRSAEVTVALSLVAGPGAEVQLRFAVPRVFGPLPLPAPLLLAGWAGALGAAAETGPGGAGVGRSLPALVRCDRVSAWQLDLGALILFDLLPIRGWRMPERGRVRLAGVQVQADAVTLVLDHEVAGTAAAEMQTPGPEGSARDLLEEGDAALRAGESRAALESYRQAAEASGVQPRERTEAHERVLALLVAGSDGDAVRVEAERVLSDEPGAIAPRLALAALAVERGRAGEAGRLFVEVAGLLERAGLGIEAACARRAQQRFGEDLSSTSTSTSTSTTTAVESPSPEPAHAPPEEASPAEEPEPALTVPAAEEAQTAWREGRLEESARAYEAVLAAPAPDPATAEAHLRLAQWARLNGQMAAANRHLGRALRAEPAGGAPAEVVVEVLDAFGRTDELVAALRARMAATDDPDRRRQLIRLLGAVLERAGRAEEAVALYRASLAIPGEKTLALVRLAEIFRRESRPAELQAVLSPLFDQLAEAAEQPEPHQHGVEADAQAELEAEPEADLEAVGLELAGLLAERTGGRGPARTVLQRLLALRPRSREAEQALKALGAPPAGADA